MTLERTSRFSSPFKSMDRSLKLFLTATVIEGFIFSGWMLFFNLFILANGFDRDYLGLVNSLPSMASLFLGIPLGYLSDRWGKRTSLLIGLAVYLSSLIIQVSLKSPLGIAFFVFLGGVGNTFYFISQAPFMMRHSEEKDRAFIFSLNYGLTTLAGVLGSLLAGILPSTFGTLFHISATSALAYEAVLLVCAVMGGFSLIPMFLIRQEKSIIPHQTQPLHIRQILKQPIVWKLAIPNLLIGLGAAVLMPYMNVFFVDKFSLDSKSLGVLFSISSLLIGVGVILGPRLATLVKGKIRAIVFSQGASLVFLLFLGFTPLSWLAQVSYLIRATLMNIANPLFSAFSMEHTPTNQQGTVNSILNTAWTLGWAIGPFISGVVQQRVGFTPLFITTIVFYGLATGLMWRFFQKMDSNHIFVPEK
jgi:MFS family permease